MNDKFKDELRERFIKLIESKRGIQAKLCKSIGKPQNYFSEIKRGNPVNANHLRAVGLVFGPEKVCELLAITDKVDCDGQDCTTKHIDSNEDTSPLNYEDILHSEVIKGFQQKKLAKECNIKMIELEKLDPNELKEVDEFLDYRLAKKQKKINENWNGKERRENKAS